MNYMQLFNDAGPGEYSIDPNSKAGQLIAAQAIDPNALDPLEMLCQLEEYLMAEHDMTLMQAMRAGVLSKSVVSSH